MSSDNELEVDCDQYEEQQQVIQDINQLVDEEFDGSDDEIIDDEEEDDNLVIHEEIVVNNDVISNDDNEEVDDNDSDVINDDNNDINDNNNEEIEDNSNEDIISNIESINESIDKKDTELSDEKVGENEVYQWSAFTGLRVKTFTAEELAQFRKPFELGWKREVVLRGTVTSSGKKIGDVYYFSPDKKTKLRSYVEMGLFLKRNSSSGLQPEHFTFARQPIFRPPAEIVRHAMQRGGGQHQLQPSQIIDSSPFTPAKAIDATAERSARNSTASESEEQFSMSIAEGRAKRKRVAPSRFEDEDYSESSPFKKKSKDKTGSGSGNGSQPSPLTGKPSISAGKQIPLQPKTQMSLQEKRRQLQHQLLQQVHEQTMKRQQHQQMVSSQMAANGETVNTNSNNNSGESIAITKIDANGKQIIMPLNARKSIMSSSSAKPKQENEDMKSSMNSNSKNNNNEISDKSDTDGMVSEPQSGAPCSMHCPGRRGMLPNLMCSRCFCLYHLDCVPGGVFLEEPRVFVCPNCLKPEDTQKAKQESKLNSVTTNGIDSSGLSQDMDTSLLTHSSKSLLVSSAPILIQQPLVKPRSTFAPILPKPPQLQQQQIYQQQQLFQKKKFVPSLPAQTASGFPASAMNVKLPAGTHLYRVATGPNGHSMIVKNKAFKPKLMKNARKSIAPNFQSMMTSTPSNPLPYYRPAPIAPIAPIKITPQQFHQQLQDILRPSRKRRGYREWMEKKKIAVQSLVNPYLCLNQVLSYLSVADLVRLKQVSRVWHQLSSQPFLWREIRLKGVQINDWQYLAKNIIEINSSVDLDFDSIRHSAQNNSDLCDLWRNFSTIVDYLKSVKSLRFGSIPTFVMEEVVNAAVTENPYNSFTNLELISVKNLFEEESDIKECRLSFLDQIQELSQLKSLHLNCKNGFIADKDTIDLMSKVFSSMNLQSLVLTSLKDFTSEQFVFLKSLKSLKHLEIGSCVNWFQCETDSESENQKQDLDSNEDKCVLKGPFKYCSELSNLENLRLIDITIDDCSSYLPTMLESLTRTLDTLTIDNLKIEPSGMDVLEHLCEVLKSVPLQLFSVSTDDSHTNKCVFDLLKKLDNCAKLLWKVGTLVEDSGECFVAFKKDDDNPEDADVENENGDALSADCNEDKYMDLTFLNEIIQSELANTFIEIIPQ